MIRSFVLFTVPFLICTYVFFIFFQRVYGNIIMDVQVKRDVPFNHRTHVQVEKYSCDTCHDYNENGRFNGIPTIGVCKQCHAPDKEGKALAMKLPHLYMYKDSDKAWSSYAAQTPLVYFSHKVVMGAKHEDGGDAIGCGSCHGDIANAVGGSKIKGIMPMGQCMDCHDAINISNKCAVCHD